MQHELPALGFSADALAPKISAETFEYHHGKHHAAYVTNLNKLIGDTEFANKKLEEIVVKSSGGIFNNAAQHYNHSFYWKCIAPGGDKEPQGALRAAVEKSFGSVNELKDQFVNKSVTLFGSGWSWLVKNPDGSLSVDQYKDAGCPLTDGKTPLLTCDVWEHAYYVDYRNARPKYVEALWSMLNWSFAGRNFA